MLTGGIQFRNNEFIGVCAYILKRTSKKKKKRNALHLQFRIYYTFIKRGKISYFLFLKKKQKVNKVIYFFNNKKKKTINNSKQL